MPYYISYDERIISSQAERHMSTDDQKYVLRFPQRSWRKKLYTYYTGGTRTTKIWEAKIFDTLNNALNKRKYSRTVRCTQVIKITDKELFKARLTGT